jgi:hypothetical protein
MIAIEIDLEIAGSNPPQPSVMQCLDGAQIELLENVAFILIYAQTPG